MMTGLWLITSGAYVGQELAAEFGQLPPAFLPVGTQRLYEYQLEGIGAAHPVYLTLPDGFAVPPEDQRRLDERGVATLFVPEGLSLGESVIFALNLIGGPDQPLWLLHGDTLIVDMTTPELDRIAIAESSEGYSWAEVDIADDQILTIETQPPGAAAGSGRPVACGLFAFAHMTALIRGITRARGNFIAGIMDYAQSYPLRPAVIESWFDFGHVQTFFRSRRLVTSARHFNTLRIDGRTVRKTSTETAKIWAEASWLADVPPPLRIYTARLIDAGDELGNENTAFYETEYFHLPTLAELFVFGSLGAPVWALVLRSCAGFLSACAEANGTEAADPLLRELAIDKTATRLRRFADETGFNIDGMLRYDGRPLPSLMQIAEDLAQRIDLASGRTAHVMHGDFCFSNILYDSRVQRVHVIDPRGYVLAGQPTTHGDLRYDLAKFAHSVIGRYDQIIAGRHQMAAPDGNRFGITFEQAPHHRWLEDALGDLRIDGLAANGSQIRALTVCLFLSMLPLHADRPDRQRAFVANALRLYAGLEDRAA